MSIKENKELIRSFFDVDAAKVRKNVSEGKSTQFAPDFTVHATVGDMKPKEFGQWVEATVAAFPDFKYTVEDIIAEGDRVVARYKMNGTHKGAYRGIAPTGKKISFEGINIFRITGGRIVEAWAVSDDFGVMQQIGAIPSGAPKI